jgi:hypothetical protein
MQMKMSPPRATEATSETTLDLSRRINQANESGRTPCYIGHPFGNDDAFAGGLIVALFANIKPENRKPNSTSRAATPLPILPRQMTPTTWSRFASHRSSLHLLSIIVRQMFS